MKFKVTADDEKGYTKAKKKVDTEHQAGFAAETYLRRSDVSVVIIRKVKEES